MLSRAQILDALRELDSHAAPRLQAAQHANARGEDPAA